MKWNVSLKVATYKLNDVINRLQGYDISILPENLNKESIKQLKQLAVLPNMVNHTIVQGHSQLPEPNPEQAPRSTRPDYKRPPKKRKRVFKQHRGLGWKIPREDQLQEKALQAIQQKGVQPFRIADLIVEAEALGSNKPAVYRAIWNQMAEGNVVRISPGHYQRTGQSFANGLGLAARAVNDMRG